MGEKLAQIRQRAFEIYQQRQNEAGDELSDWLQAEAEINGKDHSWNAHRSSGLPSAARPGRKEWEMAHTHDSLEVESPDCADEAQTDKFDKAVISILTRNTC